MAEPGNVRGQVLAPDAPGPADRHGGQHAVLDQFEDAARRQAHGWSQEEVARRMAASGYGWHQTTTGKTEIGRRPLRLNEAVALAGIFGIPLQELLVPLPVDLDDIDDLDSEIQAAEDRRTELAAEINHTMQENANAESALMIANYAVAETRQSLETLSLDPPVNIG